VDIVVSAATIGLPPEWSTHADFELGGTRNLFWRDSRGVHFAWVPIKGDDSPGPLVISSFDATTGAFLDNHLFSSVPWSPGVVTAGLAPDGTVALSGAIHHADGAYSAAVVLFKTDTFSPQLLDLGSPTRSIYQIGWDGEALAVHSQDLTNNVVEVTRLGTDGTVVLPWTPFALASGYDGETDFATDPVSGQSIYASKSKITHVRGHTREGTPLPTANLGEFVNVVPPAEMGTPWPTSDNLCATVGARSEGGFFVSWSGYTCPVSTVIQPLGDDLLPSSDTVGLMTPKYSNGSCEYFHWLSALGNPAEVRLYASLLEISLFHVVGGEATRSVLVQAPAKGNGASYLSAHEWQGERWVQFFWFGDEGLRARMVLDKEGCVYPANPPH
jgi:hypothetical protein